MSVKNYTLWHWPKYKTSKKMLIRHNDAANSGISVQDAIISTRCEGGTQL